MEQRINQLAKLAVVAAQFVEISGALMRRQLERALHNVLFTIGWCGHKSQDWDRRESMKTIEIVTLFLISVHAPTILYLSIGRQRLRNFGS